MACPLDIFFHRSVVLNQPLCGSRHGRIRLKTDFGVFGTRQVPIASCGLGGQPLSWLPAGSKQLIFIKFHLIPHHVIGCSGKLIGQGFGCQSAVGFRFFSLIESVGLRAISDNNGKERPFQYFEFLYSENEW